MSCHHHGAVYFSRQAAQRTHESANMAPVDFVAAKEVHSDIEHNKAGAEIKCCFSDLPVKRRLRWFPAIVEDDEFVILINARKQVHVARAGAGLTIGTVNVRFARTLNDYFHPPPLLAGVLERPGSSPGGTKRDDVVRIRRKDDDVR